MGYLIILLFKFIVFAMAGCLLISIGVILLLALVELLPVPKK